MTEYAVYEDRFFTRVKQVDPRNPLSCWEWQRGKHTAGYGFFKGPDCGGYAHRFSWQHFNGPVPKGLDLDHLCKNKPCVNPWHLEPVTRAENARRVYGATATHCAHGHERALYERRSAGGYLRCKECARLRQRAARRAAGVSFMPSRAVRDGDV